MNLRRTQQMRVETKRSVQPLGRDFFIGVNTAAKWIQEAGLNVMATGGKVAFQTLLKQAILTILDAVASRLIDIGIRATIRSIESGALQVMIGADGRARVSRTGGVVQVPTRRVNIRFSDSTEQLILPARTVKITRGFMLSPPIISNRRTWRQLAS